MTSDFKIIDFKNLGKRDINGFLTEKADNVWYDGLHGNPACSVRMIAKVYFPESFKDTLINEGLKLLAQKREEYKNLKPSELHNKFSGRYTYLCHGEFEKPVKINHEEIKGVNVDFIPLVDLGSRSSAVYNDEEFIKMVNDGEIHFRTWGMEFVRFDSEKKRYYISLKVKIDTKINNPESRFFNRSKSKTIWRKRVKEAYNNLVNDGFDIPVWKDYELVFEQKID